MPDSKESPEPELTGEAQNIDPQRISARGERMGVSATALSPCASPADALMQLREADPEKAERVARQLWRTRNSDD